MENRDLQQYTTVVIDFFEPLVRAAQSPDDVKRFLMELGYDPPGEVTALNEFILILSDIFNVISSVDRLVEENTDDVSNKIQIVAELIAKLSNAIKNIDSFSSRIQNDFSGSLILAQTDIVEKLPIKIVDLLFVSFLEKKLPKVHAILVLFKIIEQDYIEASNQFTFSFIYRKVNWDRIPQIFLDPITLLKESFIENDAIVFNKIIFILEEIGNAIGLFSEVIESDYLKLSRFNPTLLANDPQIDSLKALRFPLVPNPLAEFALEVYPIINTGNQKCEAVGAGLTFGSQLEIPIGNDHKVRIRFSSALQNTLGVTLNKDGDFDFINNIFNSPVDFLNDSQFSFEAKFENNSQNKFLNIGTPGGNRLEIGEGKIQFGITKSRVDINIFTELDLKGGVIHIDLSGADSFIGSAISGNKGIESTFNLGIGISNNGGVYFRGGSLEIAIPTHIQLGPLEILQIALGLKIQNEILVFSASTSFNVNLGVLQASVENIGIQSSLRIRENRDGNLGVLDVKPSFKPPQGLGLSINAGAVIGGGYLFFDFEKEEYAGALELTIAGFISAKAIGLITTKMPDGSKGFSMLIIITAEFNPPFQLGYGFTLNAVGGLLGLNRTVLLDPLRDGVRTGAVNSIMFPQNVIANAPRIISDLKAIFPPFEGKFLIGPMAKIGWGTPTLVSLSFGLIIEIPGNIAILGVLKIILPDEKVPIVKIQVAFVGTIDFDKKMLTFDASLYESSILQTMTLEGDMAVRLAWGDQPDFIMTVGGFHPSYTPPPLALPTLRRLAINILNTSIARIRVECYQALTSNTVQFGARAEIFFDLRVCKIEGFIAFDALFQFNPFYFIVEVAAGFKLKVAGLDLLSVRIRMSLEGPTPWRAKGSGSISLLFFEVSADFDKTWGENKTTTLPEITILPLFIEQLEKKEQWSTVLSTGKNIAVSLRKFDEATESLLVLHPAGSLVLQQKLLPLKVNIDKIGNQKTADVKQLTINSASSNGTVLSIKEVKESFARAQYQNLSNAEKLSKPSFEEMQGGVEISTSENTIQNGRMVRRKIEYELTIVDKEPLKPLPFGKFFLEIGVIFNHFIKGNSVSKSKLSKRTLRELQPFERKLEIQDELFTVAYQHNNRAFNRTATFSSEMEAQSFMQEQIKSNPNLKKQVHIVSQFELQEI